MKSLLSKFKLLLLGLLFSGGLSAQQFLTLDKSLEIAYQNSPSIKTSLLNLERSQQLLKAQKAALKSQFVLSLNPLEYSRNRTFDEYNSNWYTNESLSTSGTFRVDQPILATDGTLSLVNTFGWQNNQNDASNITDESYYNNLYLSFNQPLFTYNTLKQTLKTLELDLENSNLSYAMAKLNLERNVTQYFYNVYMAQMSLSIAQDELKNTEQTYEITKNKVDAGLSAMEELYQAELNFANSKSNVQNQKVSLENSKDLFKQFLGMDINEEIMVMTDVQANPVEVDLDQAIEYGLNGRMEIRQREIDVENAQFNLISVKAQNEFRGDLTLSVGVIGNNERLRDIYETPTQNPRVSLSFNIPIFDWGEKKARIAAQEAVIESQELNLSEEKKQIVIDIRSVYRSLQNQKTQIEIAQQNEKNAQLTYEINQERYRNGDLTGMDLNLYQTQLSETKMSYAQSLIDYKIELLNLKIQTLYDFEKQEAIIPEEFLQESSTK